MDRFLVKTEPSKTEHKKHILDIVRQLQRFQGLSPGKAGELVEGTGIPSAYRYCGRWMGLRGFARES